MVSFHRRQEIPRAHKKRAHTAILVQKVRAQPDAHRKNDTTTTRMPTTMEMAIRHEVDANLLLAPAAIARDIPPVLPCKLQSRMGANASRPIELVFLVLVSDIVGTSKVESQQ
jgi:hypothetical protein